ncbi:MAG TPA: hypothetical protein VGR87_08750 [Candidatus Limnocylindria bacterium]|jgi:hypothetical protein|nr:hypothetical protein [Candidatus Limnocylindria bacterium]
MSALSRLGLAVFLFAACASPGAVGGSPSPTTASSPTSSPTAPPTPSPSPTSDPSAAALFKTLTTSWRPTTTTLIVSEIVPVGQTANMMVVAVPADGGAPTALVTFEGGVLFAVRPDGGAIAAAVGGGIALWEPSGVVRWLVPPDPAALASSPVWAPDGSYLVFGRFKPPPLGGSTGDLGIFRIQADGSGLRRIVEPAPPGQGPPTVSVARRVTQENILVWGRAYEGASLEILDLMSGRQRSYDGGVAELTAWRSTQARALLIHCSNTGCRGLVEWNDETGAKREIFGSDVGIQGADRDPAGARIVVARRSQIWGLDVVDGAAVTRIPGTAGAQWPRWLPAGIAYLWGPQDIGIGISPLIELRIVSPAGEATRTLYRVSAPGSNLFITDVVKR